MKMGRQDIEAVYCLNATEYEAFKLYFDGNTVPQIGQALNMTNSSAGEKRINRGELPSGLSIESHGSTQENSKT
jgi:hypothetical protein